MNFIEALKANETEEVYIVGQPLSYNIGCLKLSNNSVVYMMEQKFKIVKTPRIVEFECEWVQDRVIHPIGDDIRDTLLPMVDNRKWRVRCEEIL